MRRAVCLAVAVVGLVPWAVGIAYGQAPPIKPGLWQVHSEREVDGQRQQMPDMSERMRNMPPEVRQRMEAMMKERGVDMARGGDMRICLTKESLDRERWRDERGTCKTDYSSRSGNTWTWHTSCREPASETDGEATFASSESYTVKTTTRMNVQGEARASRMTLASKWLGADCGDVKPITPRP